MACRLDRASKLVKREESEKWEHSQVLPFFWSRQHDLAATDDLLLATGRLFLIPLTPSSRIIRQSLMRDIDQRMESPSLSLRIQRRIAAVLNQFRNRGRTLLRTE